MAHDMEDLTGDRGVLKKVLRAGVGPVVPRTASVRCKLYPAAKCVQHHILDLGHLVLFRFKPLSCSSL